MQRDKGYREEIMKYLVVMLLVVIAYSAGVFMGWNAGVRDGKNLEVCNVQC